jgi:hypothetical protein
MDLEFVDCRVFALRKTLFPHRMLIRLGTLVISRSSQNASPPGPQNFRETADAAGGFIAQKVVKVRASIATACLSKLMASKRQRLFGCVF